MTAPQHMMKHARRAFDQMRRKKLIDRCAQKKKKKSAGVFEENPHIWCG